MDMSEVIEGMRQSVGVINSNLENKLLEQDWIDSHSKPEYIEEDINDIPEEKGELYGH